MAAMRELETGGPPFSPAGETAADLEVGRRSRETPTESSKARNWRRGEYGEVPARAHASRSALEGRESKAEMA
ncbi:hypothetical protein P8452_19743 [Trifolium repens]|jgi:hypothetical protein|nr:hypothetical protein P8452_19743 [Trifolium repens]